MTDFLRLEPAPVREQVIEDKNFLILARAWVLWFGKAFSYWSSLAPAVASVGDADVTLYPGRSAATQVYGDAITADRDVTLSTEKVWSGARFRVVRTAAATGAFSVNVGSGPLKALDPGQWADVEFDGTAWFLTAAGSL